MPRASLNPLRYGLLALWLYGVCCCAASPVQAQFLFPNPHVPVGRNPRGMATGDFNRDGFPDFVTANQQGHSLSVLLNSAHPSSLFRPSVSYATGAEPLSVLVGDWDRDGRLDLATVCSRGACITLWFGVGDGTFRSRADIPIPGGSALTSGDFNADGVTDIAVGGASVFTLLGRGDGTFAPPGAATAFAVSFGLVASDFDGDGRLDVAGARLSPSGVTIAYGRGDGTFRSPVGVSAEGYLNALLVQDVNRDGYPDLLANASDGVQVLSGSANGFLAPVAYSFTNPDDRNLTDMPALALHDFNHDGILDAVVAGAYVLILHGRNDGSFEFAARFPSGSTPSATLVSDVNRDGAPDLVLTSYNSHSVNVLLGEPGGGFASCSVSPFDGFAESLLAADLNRDGVLDLAGGRLWVNLGDGAFSPRPELHDLLAFASLGLGDLNRDGRLDLVAGYSSGTVRSLLQKEDGGFEAVPAFSASAGLAALTTGDLNGDGNQDILCAIQPENVVQVKFGDGAGLFAYPVGDAPVSVAIGDLDRSGWLDMVTANAQGDSITILLLSSNGSVVRRLDKRVSLTPSSVVLGDWNGDGSLDLAVANRHSASVSVLLGRGDGDFAPPRDFPTSEGARSIAAGDMNGDGILDLIVANNRNANGADIGTTVSVLLGDGDGGFAPYQDYGTMMMPSALALGDFDGDGRQDIATLGGFPNYGRLSVLLNRFETPRSISGRATLQGLASNAPTQRIRFTLRPEDGGATFDRVLTISLTGEFRLRGLPPGRYTLRLRGSNYLATTVQANLTEGDYAELNVLLRAGDATGDNAVDLFDLVALFDRYGADRGEADYTDATDLNHDGVIDLFDLILLFENYGEEGDE